MKLLALTALLGLAFSYTTENCSQDTEIRCINDINNSYKICTQAAQEKGKDVFADIECMKYLATVGKDCWLCICFVAHKRGWKVRGCTSQLTVQQWSFYLTLYISYSKPYVENLLT